MSTQKTKYTHPPFSPGDHVALLEGRGLKVRDHQRVKRYIRNIGYQRLKFYGHSFHDSKDHFTPGTEFDHLLNLYIFDRKLRLHVLDAIERIEVATRSVMSGILSEKYGPHWFMDKSVFDSAFTVKKNGYDKFLRDVDFSTGKIIRERQNKACRHYYSKYDDPKYPPCWVVIETMSMGTWSKLYKHLKDSSAMKKIAEHFEFLKNDFVGWLHALTLIRNVCAHHGKIWDTVFPPKAGKIKKYTKMTVDPNSSYCNFVLVQAFLATIVNSSTWAAGLKELIDEWASQVPIDLYATMKFPAEWAELPFWNIYA